jgi:HSP20 family protein
MLLTRRTLNPSRNIFLDVFDDIFSESNNEMTVNPLHNIIESESDYEIELSLAGIKREDISLKVENDVLTINATRQENSEQKYNKKEIYFGEFKKSFILPDYVDGENISASLTDGMLRAKIPKIKSKTKLSKAIEIT